MIYYEVKFVEVVLKLFTVKKIVPKRFPIHLKSACDTYCVYSLKLYTNITIHNYVSTASENYYERVSVN